MEDPQGWDIDSDIERNAESDPSAICSIRLKRYFYVIAAVAVMILIGAFWYTGYYAKGKSLSMSMAGRPSAAGPGPAVGAPMAVNWISPAPGAVMPIGRKGGRGGFSSIAMALHDSIVNVSATQGGEAGREKPAAAARRDGTIHFADPFLGRSHDNIGSGFIVRNDGYIVTNYHIVRGAGAITVNVFNDLGTERYRANQVKLDEALDLALLKIEPRAPLTAAPLGDSDLVSVADDVIAIGSPFGLDQTVSRGIVSAKRKALVIEGITHANLIQTDAAINQGNSGGPLIDARGTVIGVNTAIYTPTGAFSGIGFAIPSNQVRKFVEEEIDFQPLKTVAAQVQFQASPSQGTGAMGNAGPVIVANARPPHRDGRQKMDCRNCHRIVGGKGKTVAFGYQYAAPPTTLAMNVAAAPGPDVMGAMLMTIDAGLGQRLNHSPGRGVFVANVTAGSPAAAAGLKAGDIVLKVEGRRIEMPGQLKTALRALEIGEAARLGVLRDDARGVLQFVAGTTPAVPATGPVAMAAPQRVPEEFNWKGMEIEVFTQVVAADNQGGKAIPGAEIGEIARGSAAAKAGLQADDVILEVNSLPVGTPVEMNRAIQYSTGQTANLLRLIRGGREFFVALP